MRAGRSGGTLASSIDPSRGNMRDTDLLQLALGLLPPWMVKAATFDAQARRLDIEIDFARGGRFPCPHCAKADCPVHDTAMQTWRHLDFFQHQAFLHARFPAYGCFALRIDRG